MFDLENDIYYIPFGVGLGKVMKVRRTVFNLYVEPQYTVAHKGIGQHELQVFTGLNLQLTK